MSYQSESIATIINRLNTSYFLPAIQREYVWRPDQIVELFDSLMRGYPIGTFLFWELQHENRDNWDAYSFIYHYRQDGTHNELASLHGYQQPTLVLDGQQRLTSLQIAFRGSYTVKRPYARRNSPNAWATKHFFLDLLKDPRVEGQNETGVRYGFQLLERNEASERGGGNFWFEVGQILNCHTDDLYYDLKRDLRRQLGNVSADHIEIFERNIDRLYNLVWKEKVISFYTEREQDYDRVLDIFVRANEGGTRLGKSDLLLSMVTLRWVDDEGTNAREDIHRLVDRLNYEMSRRNDFDKDFVLKTSLVLADLPVEYKVENFNMQNLEKIRTQWTSIKSAIERGVDLINSYGIDYVTLTSANAVIPLIYFVCTHPNFKVRGTSPYDVRNASIMRRWLIAALLNNVFGGHSDTVLRTIRRVLQGNKAAHQDFPAEMLANELGRLGKSTRFDETAVEEYLSITYGKQVTFLALSLMYDDNNWGSLQYTQDHIFPKSWFTSTRLKAAGIASDRHKSYSLLAQQVGNLELLLDKENEEKSNQGFESWINSRDATFRQRHLIPTDRSLYKLDKFEEFIAERDKLIHARLTKMFAS